MSDKKDDTTIFVDARAADPAAVARLEAAMRGLVRAFPCTRSGYAGMTLRDYFAAKALQSVLGSLHGAIVAEECDGDFLRYAAAAYKIADAMLTEREKP